MATFKKMTLAFASLAPTLLASSAPSKMTVGVIGGWRPAPLSFCNDVMPKLIAKNITIPREVQNDCDPGDRAAVSNATALQADTASYIGKVCEKKGCSAFVSVGDNFYDSGVDFTTGGIIRFQEAWVNMYRGGVFDTARWYDYECGGRVGAVDAALALDDVVVASALVDSHCFISKYQKSTSVYQNPYTAACRADQATQVALLEQAFASSKAQWKFLQLHHGYMSASENNTDLAPLIAIVEKHGAVVLNGHDHCLAHFYNNNTNFILAGGAGYPQAGDCNNGVSLGPYAKWLGANSQGAANGFVTMDISREEVNVEYYARDMKCEGGDLYPVKHDMKPSYSFKITRHAW